MLPPGFSNAPLSSCGNSLMEYALPIALVVVASGALFIAVDWQHLMQGQTTATVHGELNNRTVTVHSLGELADPSWAPVDPLADFPEFGSSNAPPPGPNEDQFCWRNGFCVNLPRTEKVNAGETAGGLGGRYTRQQLAILEKMNQALMSDPANRDLVALLTKTALKGHELAGMQDQFKIQKTVDEHTQRDVYWSRQNQFGALATDLVTFLNSNPNTLPPQAASIIKEATRNINRLSDLRFNTVAKRNGSDLEGVKSNAIQITNNANTVCATRSEVENAEASAAANVPCIRSG